MVTKPQQGGSLDTETLGSMTPISPNLVYSQKSAKSSRKVAFASLLLPNLSLMASNWQN